MGDAVPSSEVNQLDGVRAHLLLGRGRQVRRLGQWLAHPNSVSISPIPQPTARRTAVPIGPPDSQVDSHHIQPQPGRDRCCLGPSGGKLNPQLIPAPGCLLSCHQQPETPGISAVDQAPRAEPKAVTCRRQTPGPERDLHPLSAQNGQIGCPRARRAAQPRLASTAPSGPVQPQTKDTSFDYLLGRKRSKRHFQARNRLLTWGNVELRGLEPLASCMPCKSGNPPAWALAALTCELGAPVCP